MVLGGGAGGGSARGRAARAGVKAAEAWCAEMGVEIDTQWGGMRNLIGGEGGFLLRASGQSRARPAQCMLGQWQEKFGWLLHQAPPPIPSSAP